MTRTKKNKQQPKGIHIDGKWKNAKEIDIIVKDKKTVPKKKRINRPKRKRIVQGGPTAFLNMIEFKECMDPRATSELYLTSLFNPNKGTCRGMAFGSENTALTDFRVPFEVTVPAGYGGIVYLNPLAILTTYGIYYSGATLGFTPSTSVNLTNATLYAPTFIAPVLNGATTASKIRIMGFEINIISDSTVLTKGGWQQVCYVDNMFLGFPTFVVGGSPAYTGPITYGAVDNLPMTKKFNGDKDLVLHWFPNGDEIYLQDYNDITTVGPNGLSTSGFIWLAQAPAANSVTYNFDVRVVLEYVPIDAVRTLSKKVLPIVHPLAEYYMNMLLATRWPLLVMAERNLWSAVMDGVSIPKSDPLSQRDHYTVSNRGVERTYDSGFLQSDGYNPITGPQALKSAYGAIANKYYDWMGEL